MKKLSSLIFAGSLALAGCSLNNHSESEKKWLATLAGCSVADAVTTRRVLDEGGYEMNPLIGKNPSNEELILAKSIGIGVLYAGGQLHPDKRELLYQIGTGVYCGAALWNYSQMKEKRIDAGLNIKF